MFKSECEKKIFLIFFSLKMTSTSDSLLDLDSFLLLSFSPFISSLRKVVDFGMAHVLRKRERKNNSSMKKKEEEQEEEQREEEEQEAKNQFNDDYDDESIDVGPGEGTFAYWSPEMMEGKPYGRPADLWALGVTLYIALCGVHPFDPKGVSTDQVSGGGCFCSFFSSLFF